MIPESRHDKRVCQNVMVLVSNEWQSKTEDEQKSSANIVASSTATGTVPDTATITGATTTTTTTAVAITSTISPATATIVNTDISPCTPTTDETIAPADSQNVKTSPTATTIAKIKTTETASIIKAPIKQEAVEPNDNNNEQRQQKDKIATEIVCNNNKQNDNNESKECTTKSSSTATNCNLKEDDFIASVLNYSNIKIMAENAKETPLKEEVVEVPTDKSNTETSAISHNNTENEDTIKDINESNSYMDSNTNTLQPSVTVKTQNTQNAETSQQQQKHLPHSRQEFVKSALRSILTANKTNNPTAAAGLQPNFLSQLELPEDVAGLQTTFRSLYSTFNAASPAATAPDATHTKNDCNLSDANNASSLTAADTPSLATTVPSSDCTNNGQAKILLICEGNSHPFQARTIYLTPNVECMVGRLIAKSKAAENNAIFDCKVLSRKHAVIWYTPDGKFWVKDTKSSNGTFINDNKLGDEEAELHFGDIVKFGVDVVENSRKEVHGCIIACVKLYLPDGREAISIDSSAHRSQYSGEGRISYDDLHRLNLYIQETSQREKVLASKLCSIQNILDATRKNSALCWQSMITEDQLLHRIHSLEKKLSFMEKNVPENVLRNEVLKLLDDKNSYQHTAKEALRKVYQERCDAMQMLAKMESAYTQSDNECALLRDQIMNSKQTLQDVNTRLLHLETEYNDYREDVTREQQETKEREEQRIVELTEKLHERELECDELKKKISELLTKRADLLDDEEQLLENQAIEKLDAAIADMDLGEDDDDDDEDDDDEDNDDADVECVNKRNGNAAENSIEANEVDKITSKEDVDAFDGSPITADSKKQTNLSTKVPSTLTSIFGDNINGIEVKEQSMSENALKMPKTKKAKMLASLNPTKKTSQLKRVKESTIMKWLQNSDIKKNEGSFDIFKAICNENEDGDSSEDDDNDYDIKLKDTDKEASAEFIQKSNNFTSILKNVEQNLKQLEAEIENRTTTTSGDDKTNCANNDKDSKGVDEKEKKHKDVYEFDENSDVQESGAQAEVECILGRNGQESSSTSASSYKVLSKNNKKYQLLKSSVNMLREAFNEIRDTVKDQNESTTAEKGKSITLPPPLVKLQQQFISHNTTMPNNAAHSLMETPDSSRASCDDIVDLDTDSISEVESLSLNSPVYSTHSTIKQQKQSNTTTNAPVSNNLLEEQLREYQEQVGKLNEKLHHTELEAQHTFEIMQVECDDVRQKMLNLNHIIDVLKEDKKALEQVINENKNNKSRIEEESDTKSPPSSSSSPNVVSCEEIIDSSINRINDDMLENDLADINISALEREEELITYKERLDEQQQENIELRNEITTLKLKAAGGGVTAICVGATKSDVLLKRVLPYGFVVLAIVVYFITTYF